MSIGRRADKYEVIPTLGRIFGRIKTDLGIPFPVPRRVDFRFRPVQGRWVNIANVYRPSQATRCMGQVVADRPGPKNFNAVHVATVY